MQATGITMARFSPSVAKPLRGSMSRPLAQRHTQLRRACVAIPMSSQMDLSSISSWSCSIGSRTPVEVLVPPQSALSGAQPTVTGVLRRQYGSHRNRAHWQWHASTGPEATRREACHRETRLRHVFAWQSGRGNRQRALEHPQISARRQHAAGLLGSQLNPVGPRRKPTHVLVDPTGNDNLLSSSGELISRSISRPAFSALWLKVMKPRVRRGSCSNDMADSVSST